MPDDQRNVRYAPVQEARRLLHTTLFTQMSAVIRRKNNDSVIHQPHLLVPLTKIAQPSKISVCPARSCLTAKVEYGSSFRTM